MKVASQIPKQLDDPPEAFFGALFPTNYAVSRFHTNTTQFSSAQYGSTAAHIGT